MLEVLAVFYHISDVITSDQLQQVANRLDCSVDDVIGILNNSNNMFAELMERALEIKENAN